MPTYDGSRGECVVFTYKEGLLSRVGHDLQLRVRRFELTIDDGRLSATFDPRSLEVVCAMERGAEKHGAMSGDDVRQVLDNVEREVLHPARFPEVRFASRSVTSAGTDLWEVQGTLHLHGATRPLRATVRKLGAVYETTVRIHQPGWGIQPFKALLGALKIKADVDVRVRVPAEVPL